jgi:hypothetical protein
MEEQGQVHTSKLASQMAEKILGVVAGGWRTGPAEVPADACKDAGGCVQGRRLEGLASGEYRLKCTALEWRGSGQVASLGIMVGQSGRKRELQFGHQLALVPLAGWPRDGKRGDTRDCPRHIGADAFAAQIWEGNGSPRRLGLFASRHWVGF